MSVESEILRIQHNIANTYAAVSEKGGEVPLQPNSANLVAAVASIPSGAALNAGDGLSKDGDTLNVENPVRGIYTQAEFDALTEDQKASGTYIVDDGQSGGGSGSGGDNWEVYSTEERRIGTWIDGRPLYRKTFDTTLGGSATGTTPTVPFPAGTNVIKYTCEANLSNPINFKVTFPHYFGANAWGCISFCSQVSNYGHPTGAYIQYENSALSSTTPIKLTIEYTKTTDSPEVTS